MSRLENLLGAQSLALADRLSAAEVGSVGGTVSTTERSALVTLLAHPGRSVRWLGEVLELTSSGATRLVDRLVAAGWVTRTAGADARRRHVQLTSSGRATARAVLRARQAVLGAAVAGLSPRKRRQFEELLDEVVTGLASTRIPALHVCRMCDRAACTSEGRVCPLEHTVPGAADSD